MHEKGLHWISRFLVGSCLGALAQASAQSGEEDLLFPPRPDGPLDVRPEAIARDIAALGAEDPAVRNGAEARLFSLGEAARAPLREAERGGDLRTRGAIRDLLRLLDRAASLEPSSFRFMVRGYANVGSKVPDVNALGGFWASGNRPGPVPGHLRVEPGGIRIVARTEDPAVFRGKHRGMQVFVVNAGRERVSFAASDSRLDLVQEARTEGGEWKPIEYLPSSWCGNSYHRVFLDPGECWRLSAPRYEGALRARLRFRLDREGGFPIYSAEFEGGVNPEQFTKEEGHTPTDLMDPYDR